MEQRNAQEVLGSKTEVPSSTLQMHLEERKRNVSKKELLSCKVSMKVLTWFHHLIATKRSAKQAFLLFQSPLRGSPPGGTPQKAHQSLLVSTIM